MNKKPLEVCSENIKMFDIDDTLIMHNFPHFEGAKYVGIEDQISIRGAKIHMMINEPMVRLLKEEAERGAYVVVWSRGGHNWASAVLDALDLNKYVDLIMSKPVVYFDDKPVSEWMTDRVYIKPDVKYKVSKPTKRSKK